MEQPHNVTFSGLWVLPQPRVLSSALFDIVSTPADIRPLPKAAEFCSVGHSACSLAMRWNTSN